MKYFILTLSICSFAISSLLFIKEFNIAEFKEEIEHTGFFQDANKSFANHGDEKIVCYRQTHRNFYIVMMSLAVSTLGFIYYGFEQKKKLSKELLTKNSEINNQNIEITHQKEIIEEKSKEVISGINYALHLQNAMLSNIGILKQLFNNTLVIYKPKDIVSGDFYWVEKIDNYIFIAVADCTGHGVPGAFMTVIGNSLLNQIVLENKNYSTSDILFQLHKKLHTTFISEKSEKQIHDGMDIAIIRYNIDNQELLFSGARRNILICEGENVFEVKGSRLTLDASKEPVHTYGEECLQMKKNSRIYLYTDGITDQLGGDNYKKFMAKNFINLLKNSTSLDMTKQEEMIKNNLTEWQGKHNQTDDILVLGIEI